MTSRWMALLFLSRRALLLGHATGDGHERAMYGFLAKHRSSPRRVYSFSSHAHERCSIDDHDIRFALVISRFVAGLIQQARHRSRSCTFIWQTNVSIRYFLAICLDASGLSLSPGLSLSHFARSSQTSIAVAGPRRHDVPSYHPRDFLDTRRCAQLSTEVRVLPPIHSFRFGSALSLGRQLQADAYAQHLEPSRARAAHTDDVGDATAMPASTS